MTATDERIADFLQAGYSVDFASEEGLRGGWTRIDVLRVASEHGWELDKSGRIPRPERPAPRPPAGLRPGRVLEEKRPAPPVRPRPTPPPTVQPLTRPTGATVDTAKEKISAALRSEHAPIRTAANRANDALAKLDTLLAEWDAKELARRRVAELELQLAEAKAALRGGQPGTDKAPAAPGEHKQAREWARANNIDVPPIGRVPQQILDQWRQATATAA